MKPLVSNADLAAASGNPAQLDPSANSANFGQGGKYDHLFGGDDQPGDNAPPPSDSPGNGGGAFDFLFQDRPAPDAQAPADDAPATGDIEAAIARLIDAKIPDLPDFLTGKPDELIDNWKALKAVAKDATAKAALSQLERRTAPPAKPGEAMPETEAVAKLTARIAELEPAAKQWEAEAARRGIGESIAFRHQFDAPRASILRELEAAAKKAGLPEPREAAEEFARNGSEIDLEEWADDNLPDNDRVRAFFLRKGAEFLALSHDAKAELEAPDPVSKLREWEQQEAAMATRIGVKMSEALKGQFAAAFPRARADLLAEGSGDPMFFSTPAGSAHLEAIAKRVTEGQAFTPEEIIAGQASIIRAEVYATGYKKLWTQVQELKAALEKAGAVDPGRAFVQPAPKGGEPDRSNLPTFGSRQPIRPLVSPEELARAGAR